MKYRTFLSAEKKGHNGSLTIKITIEMEKVVVDENIT